MIVKHLMIGHRQVDIAILIKISRQTRRRRMRPQTFPIRRRIAIRGAPNI